MLSIAAVLVGAAGLVVLPPTGAGAQGVARTHIGRATAEGIRSTYTVPAFLVVETFADVAGPLAQAGADSNHGALAFASLPYPGDAIVNAGSLVAVGTGHAPPASYPLYVQAENPLTPQASFADPAGAFVLEAAASDAGATSQASGGPDDAGASGRSTTSVTTDESGTMTVVAEAVITGLAFGDGVLRIASVTSRSVTTYVPGEEAPTTETSTDIAGATVGGTSVRIGPNGVTAGGSAIPVPVAELTAAVDEQLAEAGISVRTIEPTDLEGGASSTALEVVSTQALPVPGGPNGTLVQSIAGATTEVVLGAALAPQAAVPVATPPAAPAPGPVAAPTGHPTAPAPARPALPEAAPAVSAPPALEVEPVLLARDLRDAVRFFYLALILGGAVGIAGSMAWRERGLRASWLS